MAVPSGLGPRSILFVAAVLSLPACTKSADHQAAPAPSRPVTVAPAPSTAAVAQVPAKPTTQWYRAMFERAPLPGLPVYFEVPVQGTSGVAKILNGRNEAQFTASWSGKQLTIDFTIFHAKMQATADDKGALTGKWLATSPTWGNSSMDFRATPVDQPAPEARFDTSELPGDPIDLGNGTQTWRASFPESGTTKLDLEQVSPGVFNGTLIFPTGNVVYVAGDGRGDHLRMSSLIGLSLYLFDAQLSPDHKTMKGTWAAGPDLKWQEKFSAKAVADFEQTESIRTKSKNPPLAMPQLAAYKGKPLIVEIAGSWCDTCKYAAAALHDIYDKLHSRGLEVVTLTYEFTDDSAYNKQQAEMFKKDYHIPWEVIPMDATVETAGQVMPAGIDGVDTSAFPITMFVGRDGKIHAVHSSFAGPENPKEHAHWVQFYEQQAEAILDSGAPPKQ